MPCPYNLFNHDGLIRRDPSTTTEARAEENLALATRPIATKKRVHSENQRGAGVASNTNTVKGSRLKVAEVPASTSNGASFA